MQMQKEGGGKPASQVHVREGAIKRSSLSHPCPSTNVGISIKKGRHHSWWCMHNRITPQSPLMQDESCHSSRLHSKSIYGVVHVYNHESTTANLKRTACNSCCQAYFGVFHFHIKLVITLIILNLLIKHYSIWPSGKAVVKRVQTSSMLLTCWGGAAIEFVVSALPFLCPLLAPCRDERPRSSSRYGGGPSCEISAILRSLSAAAISLGLLGKSTPATDSTIRSFCRRSDFPL